MLLSVIVNVLVRVPVAPGVNLTLIVQLPLAATEPAQVSVSPKSPGLAPEKVIPLMVSVALPELFSVKVCAELVVPRFWLLKVMLEVVVPAMGALPVPVNVSVCGLEGALSEMLIDAVRLKMPPGVNVTLNVQVPVGVMGLAQLFVCEKSLALVPVTEIPVIVRFALPVLVRVKVCAVLAVPCGCVAKFNVEGLKLIVAPDPVPDRVADCWLPTTLLLLSVTLRVADRVPVPVGVNVMLIVQLPPAATEPPQVFVWPKSPGLAPVNETPLTLREMLPVLFKVKVWAALVVPRFWLEKVRLPLVNPAMGALPVPVTLTVC